MSMSVNPSIAASELRLNGSAVNGRSAEWIAQKKAAAMTESNDNNLKHRVTLANANITASEFHRDPIVKP